MASKSKRELIEPHAGDKRYVRRKPDGTFGKTVDVGRSLASDKRTKAKAEVPKGQGDRGVHGREAADRLSLSCRRTEKRMAKAQPQPRWDWLRASHRDARGVMAA